MQSELRKPSYFEIGCVLVLVAAFVLAILFAFGYDAAIFFEKHFGTHPAQHSASISWARVDVQRWHSDRLLPRVLGELI